MNVRIAGARLAADEEVIFRERFGRAGNRRRDGWCR